MIRITIILALFFNYTALYAAELNFYLDKSQISNTVYDFPRLRSYIHFLPSNAKSIRNVPTGVSYFEISAGVEGDIVIPGFRGKDVRGNYYYIFDSNGDKDFTGEAKLYQSEEGSLYSLYTNIQYINKAGRHIQKRLAIVQRKGVSKTEWYWDELWTGELKVRGEKLK